VHLVDAGVDTGGVLKQARGIFKARDTIASYALRQAAFSREICVEAVENALAGKPKRPTPACRPGNVSPDGLALPLDGVTRRVW